jgi:sugar phosphate isomerase/epimerase
VTRRLFAALPAAAFAQVPPRSTLGFSPDSFAVLRPPRTAIEFMERVHAMGGGGGQATLASFEPEYLKKVRRRIEELGVYLEVLTPLPGEDATQFDKTLAAAREAGASCIRTVCLSGRRYETFATLEQWKAFVIEAKAKLARAVPIAERHRMPIGLENHKDWTAEEMPVLLKSYSSEYLGACIDFGNNVALLDDPMELVEALAPFVINTHIKDMGVEEYADGFLLSEVALGEGFLDLKRMVAVLRQRKPDVRFSLDMLTRDPLKVPCLTERYWAPFPERNGRFLARAIAMVRAHKSPTPLQRITGLPREQQLQVEADILRRCLWYAREHLGMRA